MEYLFSAMGAKKTVKQPFLWDKDVFFGYYEP